MLTTRRSILNQLIRISWCWTVASSKPFSPSGAGVAAAAFLSENPAPSRAGTGAPDTCSSSSSHSFPAVSGSSTSSSATSLQSTMYPDLCVFDLDACFWDQEMYEMPALPTRTVVSDLNGRGVGVSGVYSGPHRISLHTGSLQALQDHADGKHGNMKVCFASSADTPFAEKIGRASLKMLEVLPGLTVWDLVVQRDWGGQDINQIGRQPPLSSNKAATHFPRIKKLTGIRYDRMLFFDDCNWGDHCGMVAAQCRESDTNVGPAVLRTPNGLGLHEWKKGLQVYAEHASHVEAKHKSR